MTTLTINIDDKKTEKVIKAVLDALELSYNIQSDEARRPLNKTEQRIYNNMKASLKQIKLHQQGVIELPDARELLNEL